MPVIKVLAIDPGKMTGYAKAEITETGVLRYFPFQMMDDVDELWDRLKVFQPRFIICEDFEFRGGHHKAATGIEYFPIQLIGVARLYSLVALHQCACYLQKPAQGKSYYTNTVLKQKGLLKRGMATEVQHGLDATRHLLQWFTFGAGYQYNNGKQDAIQLLESWSND